MNRNRTKELSETKYNADIKRRFMIYADGQNVSTYPMSYDVARRTFETWKTRCNNGECEAVTFVELVEDLKWA